MPTRDEISTSVFEIDEIIEKNNAEKYTNYYYLLHFWMKLLEQEKKVSSFFAERGYEKIAIYGRGPIGEHLNFQLGKEDYQVIYIVDNNNIFYMNKVYDFYSNINSMPIPDVIVVTPVMEYKEIVAKLKVYIDTNMVSIEEVVLSL